LKTNNTALPYLLRYFEQRSRGAEGQRGRGAEGQRGRGAEEQRGRGAEGHKNVIYLNKSITTLKEPELC